MASMLHASSANAAGPRDTGRIADRIENRLVKAEIDDDNRLFIKSVDMVLPRNRRRSRTAERFVQGGPGFVRVVDAHIIAFLNYDGNDM